MSGVSASTLVIFIATILVAAGVAGTLVTTVGDISSSAETQGDQITESIDANFELLNDGGGENFYKEDDLNDGDNAAEITVFVRNTGSNALIKEPGEIDVLVNGLFVDDGDLEIESTDDDAHDRAWAEGEVIEIVVGLDDPLTGSGNRLTVATKGTERSLEFNADV